MSIQSNSKCLLLLWTIHLVVSHSVSGRSLKNLEEGSENELPSDILVQNVIPIAVDYVERSKMDLTDSDQDQFLQERMAAVAPVVFGIGKYASVANGLFALSSGMSSLVRFIDKKCFNRGTVLPNGGYKSADGQSTTWFNELLEFKDDPVHVFCISPKGTRQLVKIMGNRVFLNGEMIVQNTAVHEELKKHSQYQKCKDGSKWYTNLPVGDKMTPKEVTAFKKEQNELAKIKDKNMKKLLAQEERAKTARLKAEEKNMGNPKIGRGFGTLNSKNGVKNSELGPHSPSFRDGGEAGEGSPDRFPNNNPRRQAARRWLKRNRKSPSPPPET